MYMSWTDVEINFLKENVGKYTDKEIASIFTKAFGKHISAKAIQHKRIRLEIHKHQGQGKQMRPIDRSADFIRKVRFKVPNELRKRAAETKLKKEGEVDVNAPASEASERGSASES